MRVTVGAAAVAVFGAVLAPAGAAETGDVAPAEAVWLTPPSKDFHWRDWPARALRLEISGSAVLNCKHDEQGRLSDCKVIRETRPEIGFGDAARRLAKTSD